MKKIYSFIALMLMCFVGTANAQDAWDVESLDNVEAIQAGPDHFYLISGADNSKYDDEGTPVPGKDASNVGKYMTGSSQIDEPKAEAVWSFIQVDEKNGLPVYVLLNAGNGKYLANAEERFTNLQAKAFQFTAQKAVLKPEAEIDAEGVAWEDYSNAVSDSRSVLAEGKWVFCHKSEKTYMCFYGNPAFAGYTDTNNWNIFPAKQREMTAHEKLVEAFGKYFAEGFDETLYPKGNTPGCVSEEFYNKMEAIYNEAVAATGDPKTSEEKCEEIRQAIIDIFEELKTAKVPVGEGYFVFKNVGGRGFLTVFDESGKGRGNTALGTSNVTEGTDYNSWTPESVTSWTLNNAKYIWKLEESKEEGKLLFKNFGTGKYLTTGNDYATVDKAEDASDFTVSNHKGLDFLVTFGNNGMVHVANHSNNKLLNYNDPNDAASRWNVYTISSVVIDSLTQKVEQSAKNEQLAALVKRANSDIQSVKLKNGFVDNGTYNHPSDSGLVRELLGGNAKDNFTGSNATDPSEGSIGEMFDGKMNTYYHTSWHAEVAPEGNHWIAVDLGHEVSELIVKFSQRHNAHNGDPRMFKLMAPEGGDIENPEWNVLLAETADTLEYQYASSLGDSTTYIGKFKLSEPAQYVRFVVTATTGNQFPAGEGSGPCWHVSEMRFYDAAECVDNPNFLLIPEETRNALTELIAKAEGELAAKAATQETYDALDKALDAFWEAYPDASSLKNALDEASKMVENAVEGEGMGFFAYGSQDALRTVINKMDEEIKAKEASGASLTLAEIKAYEKELDEAIAAFNAKLVKPEAGKVYQIVCKNGMDAEGNDKAQNEGMIASVNADFYNASPVYRYKKSEDDGTHFNTLWLVEETENGLAFKNLANGLYLNNVYEGLTEEEIEDLELPNNLIGYSKTPKSFSLESFTAEGDLQGQGFFLMSLKKGQFLNFESTGNIVRWWDRNDANSALTFSEVTVDDGFSTSYNVDVTPGKVQVITLPIDIAAVYANNGAYTVNGINGNRIELAAIEEGAAIEAGTPFIVMPTSAVNGDDDETFVQVELPNETLEENLNLNYNYSVVVKNGLVSAPFGFEVEEGVAYGVLVNNTVIASEGGDKVAAGTGFFNNTLPVVTEEGDAFLPVEGTIAGEGTAVENVEIVKNVASDVYTISGVKVRNNVKAGAATQGLPKGVYIVGGKKVIVK